MTIFIIPKTRTQMLLTGGIALLGGVSLYVLYNSVFSDSKVGGSESQKKGKKAKSKEELQIIEAEEYKTKGNAAYNAKKFSQALNYYTLAINSCPQGYKDACRFYGNRAACYSRLEKYPEALKDCEMAISLLPEYHRAYQRRGRIYEIIGEYQKSINDYLTALKFMSDDGISIRGISSVLATLVDNAYVKSQVLDEKFDMEKRQEYQEIVDDLMVKLEEIAYYMNEVSNLGHQEAFGNDSIQVPIQRVISAIATFRSKISIKGKVGKYPPFLFVNGYLETFNRPIIEESLEELQKKYGASKTNSLPNGDLDILLLLAQKQIECGHYANAFDNLVVLLSLDPQNLVALEEQGMLYHLSGRLSNAQETYLKILKLKPDCISANIKLANTYFMLENISECKKLFQKCLTLDPNDICALFHFAQVEIHVSGPANALSYYDRILDIDPNHYETLNQKGLTLMGVINPPDFEGAEKCFRKCIEILPSKADAYNSLGLLFRQKGRDDDAISEFEKATSVDPKNPAAYTNKGFVMLHKYEDHKRAKELFTEALRVDPSCIEAWCNLAIVYLQDDEIDDVISCYDKAIELTFFEQDLQTIYTFREGAELRKMFYKNRNSNFGNVTNTNTTAATATVTA